MSRLSNSPFGGQPDWQHLPLAQQVAQMVVVRASGHLFDHQIRYPAWEPSSQVLRHWLGELGVGGVILLGGSAAEVGLRSQQLQSWAQFPLFLAADIEEGVGQRFAGATELPPPMAIAPIARRDLERGVDLAYQMGKITAQEAIAIGLNWLLAPVVDVNNNPANPVINVRAFGDHPDLAGKLAAAFIRGAHEYPVLTTAKHFPGHGDTATDSHLELPHLPHSRVRLEAVELPPFRAAIAAGVDSVMSAHLLIPDLDPVLPATLSPRILAGLLRRDLSFDGLVVTDALVMGAIARRYGPEEACILAVEAGADILLMPFDAAAAVQAICGAVGSGRIPAARVQASLERIAWAKRRISTAQLNPDGSPHAWEAVPPPPIQLDQVAQSAAAATVAAILQASMQTEIPQPLVAVPAGRNVIWRDDGLRCDFLGHHTPAIAQPLGFGYTALTLLDRYTPAPGLDFTTPPLPTLVQIFVRGNPFRGSAGLPPLIQSLLTSLIEANQLRALVVYGSPYLVAPLRSRLPTGVALVFIYGQMAIAQRLAMAALFDTPTQAQDGFSQRLQPFTT
ncbi:MAG: glycoside hydrolase family 3 N-terminal domain-containing protein [Elainellaceae cyanobacterium]